MFNAELAKLREYLLGNFVIYSAAYNDELPLDARLQLKNKMIFVAEANKIIQILITQNASPQTAKSELETLLIKAQNISKSAVNTIQSIIAWIEAQVNVNAHSAVLTSTTNVVSDINVQEKIKEIMDDLVNKFLRLLLDDKEKLTLDNKAFEFMHLSIVAIINNKTLSSHKIIQLLETLTYLSQLLKIKYLQESLQSAITAIKSAENIADFVKYPEKYKKIYCDAIYQARLFHPAPKNTILPMQNWKNLPVDQLFEQLKLVLQKYKAPLEDRLAKLQIVDRRSYAVKQLCVERIRCVDFCLEQINKPNLALEQKRIVLTHRLQHAKRLESETLTKIFNAALEHPELKRSDLGQSVHLALHTIRQLGQGRDGQAIPKFLRCSLTGFPFNKDSIPITLLNGKSYDLHALYNHLKTNGYNAQIQAEFKEELTINSELSALLTGNNTLANLTLEKLQDAFVINRPLQRLIEKWFALPRITFDADDFCCEIMLDKFDDPVLSISGHGFSRDNLARHLEGKQRCPSTNVSMTISQVRANNAISEAMAAYPELFSVTAATTTTMATTVAPTLRR